MVLHILTFFIFWFNRFFVDWWRVFFFWVWEQNIWKICVLFSKNLHSIKLKRKKISKNIILYLVFHKITTICFQEFDFFFFLPIWKNTFVFFILTFWNYSKEFSLPVYMPWFIYFSLCFLDYFFFNYSCQNFRYILSTLFLYWFLSTLCWLYEFEWFRKTNLFLFL